MSKGKQDRYILQDKHKINNRMEKLPDRIREPPASDEKRMPSTEPDSLRRQMVGENVKNNVLKDLSEETNISSIRKTIRSDSVVSDKDFENKQITERQKMDVRPMISQNRNYENSNYIQNALYDRLC